MKAEASITGTSESRAKVERTARGEYQVTFPPKRDETKIREAFAREIPLIDASPATLETWSDAQTLDYWFQRGYVTAAAVADAWEVASDSAREAGAETWADEAQSHVWTFRSLERAPRWPTALRRRGYYTARYDERLSGPIRSLDLEEARSRKREASEDIYDERALNVLYGKSNRAIPQR